MSTQLTSDRKKEINSDVNDLRHMMIMGKPPVNDLKAWLIEIKDLYNTKAERLELFNEIMKLNGPKILDVYYSGTIQSFFKHIQYLIRKESPPSNLSEKRTLADIALMYVWEGKEINNQNKDDVAKLYPELKLKNGDKLKLKFYFYKHKSNRICDLGNDNKNLRHLALLNNTKKYLTGKEHIEYAENEIDAFRTNVKEISQQIL